MVDRHLQLRRLVALNSGLRSGFRALRFSHLTALRQLYRSPDEIEFFSGLFSEDLREDSALAPLIGTLVGIGAFSQALTNRLLQSRIYHPETFSPLVWELIHEPQTIEGLVRRNTPEYAGPYSIGLTRADWRHS